MIWAILAAGLLAAQVKTDGSLGAVVSLSGNMVISNALGQQAGANLFHSFSLFNINTGESVLFTSSFSGATKNVIARVTGGQSSWIDGKLSSDIPGADLWLINPNGLAFGKNATLSVPGSFKASTADYIAFSDGQRFTTKPGPSEVLSVANPEAFGFLGPNPAPITVTGSSLKTPEGKSLSLVGGNIDIAGGTLENRGGRIDIVSVASAGEAWLNSAGALDVSSFRGLGNISMTAKSTVNVSSSYSGGTVYIRGGRFYLDDSKIQNNTWNDSGPVDIGTTGDIVIANKSRILTSTLDMGKSGDIRLAAGGDVSVSGTSWISTTTTGGDGNSGKITVTGQNIRISDSGRFFTVADAYGYGNAGDITIEAKNTVSISDSSPGYLTGIASNTSDGFGTPGKISIDAQKLEMAGGAINTENIFGTGAAGDISINVPSLAMNQGAIISTNSAGPGAGGTLTITAKDGISLGGNSSIKSISNFSFLGNGNGGQIIISTPALKVDGSTIDSSTYGGGNAGNIQITTGNLTLQNEGQILSGVALFATGRGGNIELKADSIDLNSGALIKADTEGGGNAGTIAINTKSLTLQNESSITSGVGVIAEGKGGNIELVADNINLNSGAFINSKSQGWGNAGNLDLNVGDSFKLKDAAIETSSDLSAGGNINITVGHMLLLQKSRISSSANGVTPTDNGGNLSIRNPQFLVSNSSEILARANAGNGGNILLAAQYFVPSADSIVNASSKKGFDGQIIIESPNQVTGTVAVLELPALNAAELLRERCAAEALKRTHSSFTIDSAGGLGFRPGDFLSSPLITKSVGAEEKVGKSGTGRPAPRLR